jgi:hypothetical protein
LHPPSVQLQAYAGPTGRPQRASTPTRRRRAALCRPQAELQATRTDLADAQQAVEERELQLRDLRAELALALEAPAAQQGGGGGGMRSRAASVQLAGRPSLSAEHAAAATAARRVEELSSRVLVLERQNTSLKATVKALGQSPALAAANSAHRSSSIAVPAGKEGDPAALHAPARSRANRKDSSGGGPSRGTSAGSAAPEAPAPRQQRTVSEPDTPNLSRGPTGNDTFRRPAARSTTACGSDAGGGSPGSAEAEAAGAPGRQQSDDSIMPEVPVSPRQRAAMDSAGAAADRAEAEAEAEAPQHQQHQQHHQQPASSRRTTADTAATGNTTFSNSSPAVQQWEEQKRLQARVAALQKKLAASREELAEAQRSLQRHQAQLDILGKERSAQAAAVRELQDKLRQAQVGNAGGGLRHRCAASRACRAPGPAVPGAWRHQARKALAGDSTMR